MSDVESGDLKKTYLLSRRNVSESPKSDFKLLGAVAHDLVLPDFEVGPTRVVDESSLIASQTL
jgi:hypothetical protein